MLTVKYRPFLPSQQPLSILLLVLISLLLPQPVWISDPLLISCVTLGKSHNLSEPVPLLL